MHKMIATTFKILLMSLLFMFLLDTTLMLVQVVSIHSKVSNLTGIMQNEIARNNCMPSAMATTFNSYFENLKNTSSPLMRGYTTNLNTSLKVDGTNYPALSEDNAADYGETVTLAVTVTLSPTELYLNTGTERNAKGFFSSGNFDYTLKYLYTVPCLRYLK